MDQAKKNAQRDFDLNLLRKLIYGRGTTLTEKREFQALYDDVSSEIVKHYVMTDEERESAMRHLHSPNDVPVKRNRTEELLEAVYAIRHNQDRGYHGYHAHRETPKSSVGEWTLYLVSVLGQRDSGSGPSIARFRQRMLDLSAVALAAAEWADEQWEEWRRKNPPRD